MDLVEIVTRIENSYIINRPNIKAMKRLVAGMGWTVKYRYGFCARWLAWACFNDCEYVLTHNSDDMRNYTA